MYVQMFKFKSRLPNEEVQRIMEERAPRFRALPKLVQKFYGYEESTGMHTGIYIWDSAASAKAYLDTELAKTIATAYQVQAPPRVELFEVIFPLRDMVTRSDAAVE